MQRILIWFLTIMSIRLANDITIMTLYIYWKKTDNLSDNKILNLYLHGVYDAMYTENRICIILLYRFLQLIQIAKNTMDRKFTSIEEVIKQHRRNRIFTRMIISANVLAVFFLNLTDLTFLWGTKNTKLIVYTFMLFFKYLVFIINAITLCFYYKMVIFLINVV